MNKAIVWVAFVLTVAGGVAAYFLWPREEMPAPPAPEVPAAAPAPETKAEPAIRHPIEQAAQAQEGQQPLPAPEHSDAALQDSLAGLLGEKALRENFLLQDIVRRVVASIDNLPREKLARRLLPVKPAPGRFAVSGVAGNSTIDPGNYARYTPFVRVAEAVDAKKLVAAYARFYPLFQQAYRDLGYPTGYFNDRLVEVIDHLLAAPEVAAPPRLVQPRVVYLFADPELEARSAGQKIMIRIGADNARRIKAKLREIRAELTGHGPKP